VSKSSNADKNGLREYQIKNSRHFLLSSNQFWQSSNVLDTIGPFRSVCDCHISSDIKIVGSEVGKNLTDWKLEIMSTAYF